MRLPPLNEGDATTIITWIFKGYSELNEDLEKVKAQSH